MFGQLTFFFQLAESLFLLRDFGASAVIVLSVAGALSAVGCGSELCLAPLLLGGGSSAAFILSVAGALSVVGCGSEILLAPLVLGDGSSAAFVISVTGVLSAICCGSRLCLALLVLGISAAFSEGASDNVVSLLAALSTINVYAYEYQ